MTNDDIRFTLQSGARLDAVNASGSWTLDFDPDSGYGLGRSLADAWQHHDSYPTLEEALAEAERLLGGPVEVVR